MMEVYHIIIKHGEPQNILLSPRELSNSINRRKFVFIIEAILEAEVMAVYVIGDVAVHRDALRCYTYNDSLALAI